MDSKDMYFQKLLFWIMFNCIKRYIYTYTQIFMWWVQSWHEMYFLLWIIITSQSRWSHSIYSITANKKCKSAGSFRKTSLLLNTNLCEELVFRSGWNQGKHHSHGTGTNLRTRLAHWGRQAAQVGRLVLRDTLETLYEPVLHPAVLWPSCNIPYCLMKTHFLTVQTSWSWDC